MCSQRIFINTAATYSRSILSAVLALFSSRWVLSALGQTDFGLFSLVGSVIVFIAFLNNVMSSSAGRYYAYAIGQGDHQEVKRWFNVACGIHLCLSIGLVVTGLASGEYVINRCLTIPLAQMDNCIWVFRISLLSAFFAMIAVPFIAMFSAKQIITERAFWGLVYSALVFILSWSINHVQGNRLVIYAEGMAIILIFVNLAQIIRALFLFPECHLRWKYWFDMTRLQQISRFAGWNLVDTLGAMLRTQGSAVLLNIYFGPTINAAYGIANQVSAQSSQLSGAMMGALYPEITSSEGRGDRNRMLSLSVQACKFGTILILVFAIPILAEIDYILKIWLTAPPAHTAFFCQLILITFLVDRLSTGYMLAVNAHGKIAAFQATVGTSMVLTLPLSWFFLHLGYAPTSIGYAFIITQSVSSFGRVLWVKHLFGVPVTHWLNMVVIPCAIVAAFGIAGAIIQRPFLPSSFARFSLATIMSLIASFSAVWLLILNNSERLYVAQIFKRLSRFSISKGNVL